MSRPRLLRFDRASSVPLEGRTDDELMTLAQAGMREAFARLVERHAARIVQICARFANDAEIGAELAQETWIAVWTRRAEYQPEGKFVVWLITVARNRARNHVRAQGVERRHEGTAFPSADVSSADQIDALLDAERQRRVRDALARLPEAMREALILRYADELRYDEIATIVRTSESTLRSRVHHGLRLLKGLLEKKR